MVDKTPNHLKVLNSDGLGNQYMDIKITKTLSAEEDKVMNLLERMNIQTSIFLPIPQDSTKVLFL
jgi:hypothetical protein